MYHVYHISLSIYIHYILSTKYYIFLYKNQTRVLRILFSVHYTRFSFHHTTYILLIQVICFIISIIVKKKKRERTINFSCSVFKTECNRPPYVFNYTFIIIAIEKIKYMDISNNCKLKGS